MHRPSPPSEVAHLRPHRPLGDLLVVQVQHGLAERLAVLAGALTRELHSERLLAGRELERDDFLLGLDAEEGYGQTEKPGSCTLPLLLMADTSEVR
jgi:hypothetical protein